MLKTCLSAAVAVTALSAVNVALAADATDKIWSGEASVTYIMKNGNSESTTMGARLRAVREVPVWRLTYRMEGSNQETDNQRTEEKYFGSAKADWKFSEHLYTFALVEHEDDRFASYDYQTTLNAGFGYTAINTDAHQLSLELGPGYRRTKLITDDVNEEATARGALNYAWQISANARLTEELSSEWGDDATLTRSQTQLKTKINSRLSLTLGYDIRHVSRVIETVRKTDTTTYVALDYSF